MRRIARTVVPLVLLGTLVNGPGVAHAALNPYAVTSFRFVSAPGDPLALGDEGSYVFPNGTFFLQGDRRHVSFTVHSGDDAWYINLDAPAGQSLHPGVFLDAEQSSVATGRAPGLEVSRTNRGCNNLWGWFAIDQIRFAQDGTPIMLQASFTQRCDSEDAPPVRGWINYDAPPQSYGYTSDPGETIGEGATGHYVGSTSTFSLTGDRHELIYSASGLRDYWTIIFDPPADKVLHTRHYDDAQRARFQSGDHPGIDVFGDGRGCGDVTGSFTIKRLRFSPRGRVTGLWATFEQTCGGDLYLRGNIRFHA